MKRWLVLFSLLVAGWAVLWAQDTLQQAEDFYRQGKYSAALTTYENLLKNNTNNPFVYYNIGNCYFKMGSKGLAAANYYRAFRLAPRDSDIRHNLSLALASGGERFVPAGVPQILHRLFFSLSLRELTGLVYLAWWLTGGCACVWLLKRKGKFVLAGCLCVLIGCASWWYWRSRLEAQPLAVIASPVAEIRSGPGTNFPASASVAQGHLVRIEDAKDAWYEVIVNSQSLKGWVEQSAVERI